MPKKKRYRKNIEANFDISKLNLGGDVTRSFTGARRPLMGKLPLSKIPKGILLVGHLEELICETPEEPAVNLTKTLVNKKGTKPLVCASGDGRLVLIISPDREKRINPSEEVDNSTVESAIELHTDFHGVEPPEIKKVDVDIDNLDHLVFCGWLNHIIYSVPKYSERRGLPFIHEARDKGDDVPKAKEKPIVCISPARDMIIMYGKEMSFTDRGIIG